MVGGSLIISAVTDQPLHGGSVDELRQRLGRDLASQILTHLPHNVPDHIGRNRARQIRQQNPHLAVHCATRRPQHSSHRPLHPQAYRPIVTAND